MCLIVCQHVCVLQMSDTVRPDDLIEVGRDAHAEMRENLVENFKGSQFVPNVADSFQQWLERKQLSNVSSSA